MTHEFIDGHKWLRQARVLPLPSHMHYCLNVARLEIEPRFHRDGLYMVRGDKRVKGQTDFVWFECNGKAYSLLAFDFRMELRERRYLRETEHKAWEILANVGDCATRIMALKKLRDHAAAVYPFKCKLMAHKAMKHVRSK